jgi:hypothetical protein
MGKTKQSVIDHRRMLVARLRVRGLSQREIQVRLATPGEDGRLVTVNPANGSPWSLTTINRDSKALDKMWREAAETEIADLKAKINAELAELKRDGWRLNDPKTVLAAIKQQRALLGLDEATAIKGTGPSGELLVKFVGNTGPDDV